jgi:CheY-like chemotaxis protein
MGVDAGMTSPRDLRQLQVLVTEDEFLIALDLEHALRHLGFGAVRFTSSLAEAHRVAATWRPDLITANLRLPDGSGRDAVCAIREHHDESAIAALYITANPELLDGEPEAVTLCKPFSDAELRRAIERALAHATADQPRASTEGGSSGERSGRQRR